MKKLILGLLLGTVLGAGTHWLLRSSAPQSPAPAESTGPHAEEPAGSGLHLTAEQVTQAGVLIASPQSIKQSASLPAYGRVLDPAPLLLLVNEITAAATAAEFSAREFTRVRTLHDDGDNASAQAVATADAAAQRDRLTLEAAHTRLLTTWGPALAAHLDQPAWWQALRQRQTALARVDVVLGTAPTQTPLKAEVAGLAPEASLMPAALLGPAGDVDPQTQGLGYFLLLADSPVPPVGAGLRAQLITGDHEQNVLSVPPSALLYHQGSAFVYVQTAPGHYERKLVTTGRTHADSVVILDGLEAKDQIVITGAQQLLSTELQAAGVTAD